MIEWHNDDLSTWGKLCFTIISHAHWYFQNVLCQYTFCTSTVGSAVNYIQARRRGDDFSDFCDDLQLHWCPLAHADI